MHTWKYTITPYYRYNNCSKSLYLLVARAYRPQRGRGHVTAILSCVPSEIQIRQRFVTNYISSCCLDFAMHIEDVH